MLVRGVADLCAEQRGIIDADALALILQRIGARQLAMDVEETLYGLPVTEEGDDEE